MKWSNLQYVSHSNAYRFFVLLWKCDFMCCALNAQIVLPKKRTHLCKFKTNWSCQPKNKSLQKCCVFICNRRYLVFTMRNHWHNSWPYNTTNTVTLYGSNHTHISEFRFYFDYGLYVYLVSICIFFSHDKVCVNVTWCAAKMF